MNNDTTILLIGHGSRNPAGNEEILRFAATWQARHPDWCIEVCFIEFAEVLMDAGLDKAAANSRQVIALPLILNAAGHVKMEIPAAIEAARERHPEVIFSCLSHLGLGQEVFEVLKRRLDRLMRELAMPDPQTTGVILLGRGSSDAGANSEVARLARRVFEDGDHELVDIAFTGVTFPRIETVVQRQVTLGMTQIVIQPLYLYTGLLIERINMQIARLRLTYPQVAFALGGHFGFDEEIFALVDSRINSTDTGGMLECDGCKYRLAAAEHAQHH